MIVNKRRKSDAEKEIQKKKEIPIIFIRFLQIFLKSFCLTFLTNYKFAEILETKLVITKDEE